MKSTLGLLTFILSIGFAIGLVLSMIGGTWYGLSNDRALIGFFGFGVPLLFTAGATISLWTKEKLLYKFFAWVSTILGGVCGVCLLLLIVGWVIPLREFNPAWGYFFGFGIPMIVFGGTGIGIILE